MGHCLSITGDNMMSIFEPMSLASEQARKSLARAILALERDENLIYPALGVSSQLPRIMAVGEATYYDIPAVETKVWIERVIRHNIDTFDDNGWSESFEFNTFDLRIENGLVWVIPWDKKLREHDYVCAYSLFAV
jgi:hypothetical protein